MIDLRERRRQLLNLTITEIILILLFLVLLIAANLIQKNKKLIEQNEAYKSLDVDAIQLAEFSKFKEAIADLKDQNGEFAEMDINIVFLKVLISHPKLPVILIAPIANLFGFIIPAVTFVRPVTFPFKFTPWISHLHELILATSIIIDNSCANNTVRMITYQA